MRADRSFEAPGPRMQFPSMRFPGLAASGVLGCVVLVTAVAAGAQEPVGAPERETPGAAEPGEVLEQPGVEVLHVRSRESGGIETEVPTSLTTFDAATIQALGVQDVS